MRKEYLAILIAVSLSILTAQFGSAQETREENAARLIAQTNDFKLRVQELHGKVDANVNDANRLKGQAEHLTNVLKAGTAQYQAATAQYSGDLSQFKNHAQQYQLHMEDFKKTMGECHANEKIYEAQAEEYKLHLQTWHMPDIRPPHICGLLNVSQDQAMHIANTLRVDQMRVAAATGDMLNAQQKLATAEQAELGLAKKAIGSSIREKREQELAGEFGKLKQEFDLLKIERQALGGTLLSPTGAGTSVNTVVHGTIKKQ